MMGTSIARAERMSLRLSARRLAAGTTSSVLSPLSVSPQAKSVTATLTARMPTPRIDQMRIPLLAVSGVAFQYLGSVSTPSAITTYWYKHPIEWSCALYRCSVNEFPVKIGL